MTATVYNPLPLITYRVFVFCVGVIIAGYLVRHPRRRPFGWFTLGAAFGIAWSVSDWLGRYVALGFRFDTCVFWLPWVGALCGLIIDVYSYPLRQTKTRLLAVLTMCAILTGFALSILKERGYANERAERLRKASLKARGDPTLQNYRWP